MKCENPAGQKVCGECEPLYLAERVRPVGQQTRPRASSAASAPRGSAVLRQASPPPRCWLERANAFT